MFAEDGTVSADDLFDDQRTKPRAQKCAACGMEFHVPEAIRFCSACGAPLGAAGAAGAAGAVSVLLAEDTIVTRRKITAILKRLGCIVTEATNGREAVGLANLTNPQLIVLDIHMPDQNGLQALDILRADEKFRKTTIIMLTGEADAKVVRDALTRGANDYVRKDSSPTELQERLNRHVQNILMEI